MTLKSGPNNPISNSPQIYKCFINPDVRLIPGYINLQIRGFARKIGINHRNGLIIDKDLKVILHIEPKLELLGINTVDLSHYTLNESKIKSKLFEILQNGKREERMKDKGEEKRKNNTPKINKIPKEHMRDDDEKLISDYQYIKVNGVQPFALDHHCTIYSQYCMILYILNHQIILEMLGLLKTNSKQFIEGSKVEINIFSKKKYEKIIKMLFTNINQDKIDLFMIKYLLHKAKYTVPIINNRDNSSNKDQFIKNIKNNIDILVGFVLGDISQEDLNSYVKNNTKQSSKVEGSRNNTNNFVDVGVGVEGEGEGEGKRSNSNTNSFELIRVESNNGSNSENRTAQNSKGKGKGSNRKTNKMNGGKRKSLKKRKGNIQKKISKRGKRNTIIRRTNKMNGGKRKRSNTRKIRRI